jgi:hypothetical protein
LSERSGKDLSAFFDQYLRTTMVPELEYRWKDTALQYRYVEIVPGFDMPVRIFADGEAQWIFPSADWKETSFKAKPESFGIDPNFYVKPSPL